MSVGNWLRKMVNHTRQRALENDPNGTDNMSDVAADLPASPAAAGNLAAIRTPTNGLGILGSTSGHVAFAAPPPPPPMQLPNSQPFIPLSASDRNRFQDHYGSGAIGTTLHPGHGVGNLAAQNHAHMSHESDIGVNDSASGMLLQGLLGDGNDWPPWLTTSVRF